MPTLERVYQCYVGSPGIRGGSPQSPPAAATAIRLRHARRVCGLPWRSRSARAATAARRSTCAEVVVHVFDLVSASLLAATRQSMRRRGRMDARVTPELDERKVAE